MIFCGAAPEGVEPADWESAVSCGDIGHQGHLRRRGSFIAVICDGECCFRLWDKEVWIGYLNRHDILACDDDASAAFREMPEPNGKFVRQTDAAV